jgi:hypothetical protein
MKREFDERAFGRAARRATLPKAQFCVRGAHAKLGYRIPKKTCFLFVFPKGVVVRGTTTPCWRLTLMKTPVQFNVNSVAPFQPHG